MYWFVLCNLQIFSGCVCHLEQLHAQSPFLFPIVSGIDLIPFFYICSVRAVLSPGLFGFVLLYLGHCAVATVAVSGFGQVGFGVSLRAASSNLPSSPNRFPSQTEVCSTIGESIQDRRLFTIQRSPRISTSYTSQSVAVQTVQVERRTSPFNGIERSLSRAAVIKTKSLPVSATTFPTALSVYIAHDGRKHKHNPTLSAIKHVVQTCRSSLSAAADGLADCSGERRTSPFNGDAQSGNGIERSLSRAVVPPSATTFPTALSLYIAQGRLRKDIRYPSSSQRQNRCHSKWKLILKTIGNRKGDCAWSCSRWQTQPEKICKSQRTNQCHSLRTLYWFVLCNLQIFSGCVCHLEQLHAQSPFLFPIVFSINLIPFFDICSVYLLAVFQPGCSGMCYFTWAAARSQQLLFVVLAAGLWCLTAGCHVKSPPLKQKCAPRSRWEKAYMRKHTYK